MKVVSIGGITLDYPMWWVDYSISNSVEASVVDNLDGGVIVFETPKRSSSKSITLESRGDGWQKAVTADSLLALSNGSIGSTVDIVDSNSNVITVRFRHEVSGGAVQFDRVFDAKDVGWYNGTIYLARA